MYGWQLSNDCVLLSVISRTPRTTIEICDLDDCYISSVLLGRQFYLYCLSSVGSFI